MIFKKIAVALSSGALLLSSLAPAAFAQNYNSEHIDSHEINIEQDTISQSLGARTKLFTFMNDEQEIPGPGDSDGFGIAKLKVNTDTGQVCAKIRVFFIEPATAAHIHEGAVGQAGPVVVGLPTPDSNGRSNGCVSIDKTKAQDILDHPSNYYVNVHNTPFPSGAVRGQL